MSVRTRYLLWLILFAILDLLIPIPILALLLIYVVVRRPPWFRKMFSDVYGMTS